MSIAIMKRTSIGRRADQPAVGPDAETVRVHGSADVASVDIYRPDTDNPAPLVVVAHGFSRKRRNMAG